MPSQKTVQRTLHPVLCQKIALHLQIVHHLRMIFHLRMVLLQAVDCPVMKHLIHKLQMSKTSGQRPPRKTWCPQLLIQTLSQRSLFPLFPRHLWLNPIQQTILKAQHQIYAITTLMICLSGMTRVLSVRLWNVIQADAASWLTTMKVMIQTVAQQRKRLTLLMDLVEGRHQHLVETRHLVEGRHWVLAGGMVRQREEGEAGAGVGVGVDVGK